MSKEESTLLKGLAILMMVFLHLFNDTNVAKSCQSLVWIGNVPLSSIIARSCSPVGIFLILSGYGLNYCRDAHKLDLKSNIFRIFKLYVCYWFTLLVFVPIGGIINPAKYPGTWHDCLENVLGISSSYNAETWFILPYALLALSSPVIFHLIDEFGNKLSLALSSLLFFASIFVIHYYVVPNNCYDAPWFIFVTYANLLVSFTMGAILYNIAKNRSLYIQRIHVSNIRAVFLFACMFCSHFFTSFQGLNPFYELFLVILFLQIRLSDSLRNILLILGKYSMPIWLTHTYYSRYIFHDFIYNFKYPLIIYVVLVGISFFTAWLMMALLNPILNTLKQRISISTNDSKK